MEFTHRSLQQVIKRKYTGVSVQVSTLITRPFLIIMIKDGANTLRLVKSIILNVTPEFDSQHLLKLFTSMIKKAELFDNIEKFNNKILKETEDSSCFSIKGYINKNGYVQFQYRYKGIKRNIEAHRVSYILHNNEELNSKDVIMHICDNPSCINPLHLKKGTHFDNVQDRVSKGRCARGSANGRYTFGKYCK